MSKLQRAMLSSFCIAIFVLSGCSQADRQKQQSAAQAAAVDVNAIADQIRQIEAQWVSEYASGDTGGLVDHYAHDATLMQPGVPAVRGMDRIAAAMADAIKDGAAFSINTEKVEVAKSGDWAYSRGTYTLAATNRSNKLDGRHTGSYLTIYRKQEDGSWKAVEDITT